MDNFKKLIKEALTPDFLKESVNEATAEYAVMLTGGSIGDKPRPRDAKGYVGLSIGDEEVYTLDKAKEKAKRMNKTLSPGEKSYYKLKYVVVPVANGKFINEKTISIDWEDDDLFDDSGIGGMEFIPDETEEKTPVLVDVWYSYHEEHGAGGLYKVIVHFDNESEETFYSLEDAEAKYDLEGVEREETEFDVS